MVKKFAFGILLFVITVSIAFSYDVVLKNGKTIKGTLITENQDSIIIKDQSGFQMSFKKTNVDLEKTAAANRPVEKPAPDEKPAEKKAEPSATEKPKKPAKVYTERDIPRLRSSSPMKDSESAAKKSNQDQDQQPEEKGEDYWRNASADLLSGMHAAQQAYNELNDGCQKLKNATIQTHVVVNEKGETMDMAETTQDYCERAEDAKGQYEQLKSEYEGFMEQARQESVPPGWLASDE